VLLLVLIYILIIAATLREVALLTFAGFITSFGIFQLALFGIGSEYLWRNHVELDGLITFVSICAGLIFASGFTISTLELRERNHAAMRFLEVMMIMTVTLLLISPFLTYEQMAPIISAVTIPTALAILCVGVLESYRGSQIARHFTLSWSLLLIGMITLALSRLGLAPNNLDTEQAAFIGFVVMVIQMSWSFASEYNRQRYQNQRREEREERVLQDALTTHLEESVRERTLALEEALAELSDTNEALMELSTIDSLTGIHNRYYFDEVFVKEWKRAIREKYPISLMLVDADHFKRINDTLGHLAGDSCLRHLARSIKQILRRPADILARYGGEEFVIVLPYIGNDNAYNLAEQIRASVERSKLDMHGQTIGMTISIGVATALPTEDDDQQDLVSAADIALYEAKNSGRNLVRNSGRLKKETAPAAREPG
jgi:diguanylate cyclase